MDDSAGKLNQSVGLGFHWGAMSAVADLVGEHPNRLTDRRVSGQALFVPVCFGDCRRDLFADLRRATCCGRSRRSVGGGPPARPEHSLKDVEGDSVRLNRGIEHAIGCVGRSHRRAGRPSEPSVDQTRRAPPELQSSAAGPAGSTRYSARAQCRPCLLQRLVRQLQHARNLCCWKRAASYIDETRRSFHLGPIAPAAGQLVSPTRLRFISKKRTGSLPGTTRSPTSRHVPSLTTAV